MTPKRYTRTETDKLRRHCSSIDCTGYTVRLMRGEIPSTDDELKELLAELQEVYGGS
jgi:hypothetical protein